MKDAIKTYSGIDILTVTKFIVLSALATIVPFFIHFQWITGPMINAILILTIFFVGIRSALILCMVPSLMALSGGLIPAVLAPAVPFIMIGNAIFVLSIDYFYNNIEDKTKGYLYGLAIGSYLKFAFLYFSVKVISNLLLKKELIANVSSMMSWPQFATALTGGLIAFVIIKKYK